MAHLKGLEAHTRVFDASDHTVTHGEPREVENEQGQKVTIAAGQDVRFDKWHDLQEKKQNTVIDQQAQRIAELEKQLAKLKSKSPADKLPA